MESSLVCCAHTALSTSEPAPGPPYSMAETADPLDPATSRRLSSLENPSYGKVRVWAWSGGGVRFLCRVLGRRQTHTRLTPPSEFPTGCERRRPRRRSIGCSCCLLLCVTVDLLVCCTEGPCLRAPTSVDAACLRACVCVCACVRVCVLSQLCVRRPKPRLLLCCVFRPARIAA
jgi:hypothetical protein